MNATDWRQLAEAEVEKVLEQLPEPLREQACQLPVTLTAAPSPELQEDGIEPDTLGLFVGEPWAETGSTTTPLPAQIILFIDNLRTLAEEDPEIFCEEVRVTYVHELGHYLGLEEEDLVERGLE